MWQNWTPLKSRWNHTEILIAGCTVCIYIAKFQMLKSLSRWIARVNINTHSWICINYSCVAVCQNPWNQIWGNKSRGVFKSRSHSRKINQSLFLSYKHLSLLCRVGRCLSILSRFILVSRVRLPGIHKPEIRQYTRTSSQQSKNLCLRNYR